MAKSLFAAICLLMLFSSELQAQKPRQAGAAFTRNDFELSIRALEKSNYLAIRNGRPSVYEIPDSGTMIYTDRKEHYGKGLSLTGEQEDISINPKEIFTVVVRKSSADLPRSDMKITFFRYETNEAASRELATIEEYAAWLRSPVSGRKHLVNFWIHKNGILLVETRSKDFSGDFSFVVDRLKAELLKL